MDDPLASAVCLEELRVGRHYIRDAAKMRVGSIWVDTLWRLEVFPSFDNAGVVAVVAAHGEEFRDRAVEGWVKAVLSSADALVVEQIDADPLPSVISALPLLSQSNSMSLDGVSYDLRFETVGITGTLEFSNPRQRELVALEQVCLHLARQPSESWATSLAFRMKRRCRKSSATWLKGG